MSQSFWKQEPSVRGGKFQGFQEEGRQCGWSIMRQKNLPLEVNVSVFVDVSVDHLGFASPASHPLLLAAMSLSSE